MDCGSTILIFLAFIQATCGQTVTLTGPPDGAVEQGSETVYTCTGGTDPYNFRWTDVSVNVDIFFAGEKAYPINDTKYLNFEASDVGDTSTMTISNTLIEDEGRYRCGEGQATKEAELTVEDKGTWSMSVESTIESNIDMYVATCEALDGRPEVTITWMLGDDPLSCDSLVETNPTAGTDLSSTRSVCTFQATSENIGQTLKCVISGHQVSDLNGEETTTLNIHKMPTTDITVGFQSPDPSLTVSCDIADPDQPIPSIRNYYIYSDGTLIHQSSTGDNNVEVPDTEFDLYTNFTCVAGNYLGNVTSDATRYDPTRTTTPTPTTTAAQEKTTPVVKDTTSGAEPSAKVAAIAGGVVGAIVVIVIIVIAVCYCKKEERFCFEAGGTKSSGSSKPAGSAVGSSNGSEREKTKPEAAPRGHGSIQHTNDNPNQDMYAMVDKKPSGGRGGDAPDRGSGPGQNEPQGMLYADLDLSHKAGHTDKHVPKNENDVVVYSSILV